MIIDLQDDPSKEELCAFQIFEAEGLPYQPGKQASDKVTPSELLQFARGHLEPARRQRILARLFAEPRLRAILAALGHPVGYQEDRERLTADSLSGDELFLLWQDGDYSVRGYSDDTTGEDLARIEIEFARPNHPPSVLAASKADASSIVSISLDSFTPSGKDNRNIVFWRKNNDPIVEVLSGTDGLVLLV